MAITYEKMKTYKVPDGNDKVQYEIVDDAGRKMIAPDWDVSYDEAFAVGDYVVNDGKLYRFTSAHTAGDAWDDEEVAEITVTDEVQAIKSDVSGKASKVTGATSGHFAGLDASGNPTDSGYSVGTGTPSDSKLWTSQQTFNHMSNFLALKADKVTGATENNFAALDANGNLKDSGKKPSDFLTEHQDISGKANKVSGATDNHFAALDGNGDLKDSGKSASDFVASSDFTADKMPMSASDSTKVATAVTELKSAIDGKADIIRDTVQNVAIASVPDGASNLPLSALQIAVEPVQDLHGQDAPYPAGGGKNILPTVGLTHGAPSSTVFSNATQRTFTPGTYVTGLSHNNYYMNQAGDAVIAENSIKFSTGAQAYGVSIPFVGLEIGSKYTISAVTTLGVVGLSFYQQDGTFISGGTASASIKSPYTAIIPENTYYSLAVFASTANNTETTFTNIQLEKGSSASSFAPYANICPITGWTGCEVTRTGKNLIYPKYESRTTNNVTFTVNADGTITTSTNGTASAGAYAAPNLTNDPSKMQRIPAGTYKLTGGVSSSEYVYLGGKYIDGSALPSGVDTGAGKTYTLTQDAYVYPQICITSGTASNRTFYIQLELGSTAHAYTPFVGSTIPISWQTEAGTVYGGTSYPVNGVLTMDKAIVDLGTLTWYDGTTAKSGLFYTFGNTLPYVPKLFGNLVCSEYKGVKVQYSMLNNGEISIDNTQVQPVLRVRNDDFNGKTTEQVKTALTGVKLAYELATPVTYNLTDLEVIETLKGVNNVWADCGNILLMEYGCDTKGYIDKKLAELTALILENN